MKYLEREEVTELEDEGMSELLLLKDKIMDTETAQTEQYSETVGTHTGTGEPRTVNKHPELRLKQPTPDNATANELMSQPKITAGPQVSVQLSGSTQQQPGQYWRKDFKVSGQIGEPGQRDRLTFSSLAHQIENGLNRGHTEI